MKQIEWSEIALPDLASLDKAAGRRLKLAVEHFAETESGNVKKLQGINPPEYRLVPGNWQVRFTLDGNTLRILRIFDRKDAYR